MKAARTLKPLTLKALYQQVTGDTTTHQRTIAAAFARLDPRRQQIIRARVAGASLPAIAADYGITAGSVQSVINGGLGAMRKQIKGEPRYNQVGRGGASRAA